MPLFRTAPVSFLLLVSLLLLGACAGTPLQPDPPEISVSGVKPVELGLDQQVFRFTLEARNPNKFDLDVEKIEFVTRIGGIDLGKGVSTAGVSIPAGGSAPTDIDVTLDLARAVNDLKTRILSGGINLEYELDGNIHLAGGVPAIPFTVGGNLLGDE